LSFAQVFPAPIEFCLVLNFTRFGTAIYRSSPSSKPDAGLSIKKPLSPEDVEVFHCIYRHIWRPRRDSNPQPSDPKQNGYWSGGSPAGRQGFLDLSSRFIAIVLDTIGVLRYYILQ
jgi:hypothetical protein